MSRYVIATLLQLAITDPESCTGEILIEGPILADGYLHDIDKTSAAFVPNPHFSLNFEPQTTHRMYKTGDLAYYSQKMNGDIEFVGRKVLHLVSI